MYVLIALPSYHRPLLPLFLRLYSLLYSELAINIT